MPRLFVRLTQAEAAARLPLVDSLGQSQTLDALVLSLSSGQQVSLAD